MKPRNASNSSVVVVGLLPTRTFNEFLYKFLRIFLISANSLKFTNFFRWGNEFSIYDPGLQRNWPPADRRLAGRPVSRHLQSNSVDRQNDGDSVACCYQLAAVRASVHAVLTYGKALSDRIVLYRVYSCPLSCPCQKGSPTPTNHYSGHKTRVNDLSCGMRMRAQISFLLSQNTRLTDSGELSRG